MANNINEAFRIFLRDSVSLDPAKVETARLSQNWLVTQIHSFQDFLPLYPEIDIFFGAFARRTKKRPLDDIDLMIGLHASGCTYLDAGTIYIEVPIGSETYKQYTHDNSKYLNSRLVINRFVANLQNVSQYRSANIKRNQEASTLQLNSYEWSFDIVPCLMTTPEYDGRTFYLIPDGSGHWKKTDPRIDRDLIKHEADRLTENLLNIIRIMKYWNNRATMPSMGSYLLENLIIQYYSAKTSCSYFPDLEIPYLLKHISTAIFLNVHDPKNIQGDLNNLDGVGRSKISNRAIEDFQKAINAAAAESRGDMKTCFSEWRKIFGEEFPVYEAKNE